MDSASSPVGGPIRTLIVDDVGDLRFLYRRALEHDGRFRVAGEAADGTEAIRLAGELRPDVVLLDMAMPGMGGGEALPRLRRLSPTTRVVLVSGMDLDQRAPLLEAFPLAYLEKALSPRAMVSDLLVVIKALEEAEAAIAALGFSPAGEATVPAPLLTGVPADWSRPERLADLRAGAEALVAQARRWAGGRFEMRILLGPESIRLAAAVGTVPPPDSDWSVALGPWALRSGVQLEPWGCTVWADILRPD